MPDPHDPQETPWLKKAFAAAVGALLGLALLKFPNPAIMERFVVAPKNSLEWLLASWPLQTGYLILGAITLAAVFVADLRLKAGRWLALMPVIWLGWQFISATGTTDAGLTSQTLVYFVSCAVCFYLGLLALPRGADNTAFWIALGMGFLIVLASGWHQRFIGLKETREFVAKQEATHWLEFPPDEAAALEQAGMLIRTPEGFKADAKYLQRAQSNRISATLFYPNSLAGAVLLLLPVVLTRLWRARERFTVGARGLLCGLVVIGGAGCLFWSGSKGGWAIAVAMIVLALWRQNLARKWRVLLVCGVILGGVAGFYIRNKAYIQRGATSVVARFDYWKAAWQTACANPVLGSGPGTFGNAYLAVKKPESEMARLAHNDYLQMVSDSGFPGLIAYLGFVIGTTFLVLARLDWKRDAVECAVLLGLLSWIVQSLMEFPLYIPSLSWTAFVLMGWLARTATETIRQPKQSAHNLKAR